MHSSVNDIRLSVLAFDGSVAVLFDLVTTPQPPFHLTGRTIEPGLFDSIRLLLRRCRLRCRSRSRFFGECRRRSSGLQEVHGLPSGR